MKQLAYYDVRKIHDLKDMIESSCKIYEDKPAFLRKEHGAIVQKSYGEFYDDVASFGCALLDEGMFGKKIAILSENRYEWAVSFCAVTGGVGVAVPLDKELPENEITQLLTISDADAVICSPKTRGKVERAVGGFEKKIWVIDMELDLPELILRARQFPSAKYRDLKVDPDKMAALFFTSGTTGVAKGVMLSHTNICSTISNMAKMIYAGPGDVFLSLLPLHHTYGCVCDFLSPIYLGAAIAYCDGVRHIQRNFNEYRITAFMAVPLLFENIHRLIIRQIKKKGQYAKMLVGMHLSDALRKFGVDKTRSMFKGVYDTLGNSLRLFIAGAASIDPEVIRTFESLGITMVQGYGLTECSPIVTLNSDKVSDATSAGLPMPDIEVKIFEPDESGNGEVIVKGPNVMLGYYNDPEATSKVIKDGWFHTGDVGRIDEKTGFLYITGRIKNVIVTKNGKNIYPEEMELYLSRCEYISQSMVYGKTDAESGDTIVASQILPDEDAVRAKLGDDYSEEELLKLLKGEIDSINAKVQDFKRIRDFKVRREGFQMTTTMKVKRYMENTDE